MWKKLILCSIIFCLIINANAQSDKATEYVKKYKDIAIIEMKRSGVPAAITLAQGMLESGYGESNLCKKSNNHFGIKCKTEWTGEKTYHNDDEKGECFRVYPSAAESYKDHSDFLKSRSWYNFLFKLDPTDYEGWAKGLKKAGYATEKDYPQRLIKIIIDYNLQQYSLLALNKASNTAPESNNLQQEDDAAASQNANLIEQQNAVLAKQQEEEKDADDVTNNKETVISPIKKTETVTAKANKYPEGLLSINHAKAIYAKEGTSLLALANQFGISISKLIAINDMDKYEDILDTDKLIFLEYKLKKGAKDYHIVEEGETLYSISQTEGVQLNSLLNYNKATKDRVLKLGDKIFLHSLTSFK